jgi:hypothetical protein
MDQAVNSILCIGEGVKRRTGDFIFLRLTLYSLRDTLYALSSLPYALCDFMTLLDRMFLSVIMHHHENTIYSIYGDKP